MWVEGGEYAFPSRPGVKKQLEAIYKDSKARVCQLDRAWVRESICGRKPFADWNTQAGVLGE